MVEFKILAGRLRLEPQELEPYNDGVEDFQSNGHRLLFWEMVKADAKSIKNDAVLGQVFFTNCSSHLIS